MREKACGCERKVGERGRRQLGVKKREGNDIREGGKSSEMWGKRK